MTTKSKNVDWGGLNVTVKSLSINADDPGTSGDLVAGSSLTVDGAAGTGAASAGVLALTTPETTIAVGTADQLGRITFSAPAEASGTDAILVGAAIWAEAAADFTSTANTTDLVFACGVSEAAAEVARVSSVGNITCDGYVNPTGGFRGQYVVLPADDTTITILAADSGKVHLIPDLDATSTAALPTAADGLWYEFEYVGGAADAHNFVIDATGFFIGGLGHADVGGTTAAVYSNGSSNDILTLVTPAAGTRVKVVCNGTNWYVSGIAFSATIPTFAD